MTSFNAMCREYAEQGITNPADLDRSSEWALTQEYLRACTLEQIQCHMGQILGTHLVSMTLKNIGDDEAYYDLQSGLMGVCRSNIEECMRMHVDIQPMSTPAQDDAPHWEADARAMYGDLVR